MGACKHRRPPQRTRVRPIRPLAEVARTAVRGAAHGRSRIGCHEPGRSDWGQQRPCPLSGALHSPTHLPHNGVRGGGEADPRPPAGQALERVELNGHGEQGPVHVLEIDAQSAEPSTPIRLRRVGTDACVTPAPTRAGDGDCERTMPPPGASAPSKNLPPAAVLKKEGCSRLGRVRSEGHGTGPRQVGGARGGAQRRGSPSTHSVGDTTGEYWTLTSNVPSVRSPTLWGAWRVAGVGKGGEGVACPCTRALLGLSKREGVAGPVPVSPPARVHRHVVLVRILLLLVVAGRHSNTRVSPSSHRRQHSRQAARTRCRTRWPASWGCRRSPARCPPAPPRWLQRLGGRRRSHCRRGTWRRRSPRGDGSVRHSVSHSGGGASRRESHRQCVYELSSALHVRLGFERRNENWVSNPSSTACGRPYLGTQRVCV